MSVFPKNKKIQFAIVTASVLISINLWSFRSVSGDLYKALEAAVLAVLLFVVLINSYVFVRKDQLFKTTALLFLGLPFLSAIGAYVYHDQPFSLSLLLLRTNLLWLFYFVLHIFKVEKKQIIKLMLFVGCVWIFLTVVQQFTYPTAFFYTRADDEEGGSSILRAGVYRFMLAGQQYGLFVLLYFFYKYLIATDQKKLRSIFFVVAGLAGFYYFGTRQFALSAVLCMGVAVMLLKPMSRVKYIVLAIPVLICLWVFRDVLFGKYIEMTNEQMQYGYEQNIRALCANFYLNDYWPPQWTAKLLGNGLPHELAEYGKEMNLILEYFHFHRSDVGVIGTYSKYGILYILNIAWVFAKVVMMKDIPHKDKYLKLFFFNAAFLIITHESFSSEKVIPFYCLIMYLIDKSVEEKKEKNELWEEGLA